MKKILITVPQLKSVGGVANFYSTLKLDAFANIGYFTIQLRKTNKVIDLFLKIFNFIQKIKHYDVIHFNPSMIRNAYYRDMIFIVIAKLMKKQIIIFWHGWENDFFFKVKKNILRKYLFGKTYGGANCIIVLGEIFELEIKSVCGVEDCIKILTPFADDEYLDSNELKEKLHKIKKNNDFVDFLFLSRIEKEKGIYIAIDTINNLSLKYKNLRLHIAGIGSELDNVKKYVEQHNINCVIFYDYVTNEVKFNLLIKCDIFFFPTYYGEGLPSTILEAMLYGDVIISRINAAIPDHVIDGENGFLIESIDYEDYIPIVEKFLKKPELINEIGRKNYEKAKKLYTKEKIKKRMLKIYNEL